MLCSVSDVAVDCCSCGLVHLLPISCSKMLNIIKVSCRPVKVARNPQYAEYVDDADGRPIYNFRISDACALLPNYGSTSTLCLCPHSITPSDGMFEEKKFFGYLYKRRLRLCERVCHGVIFMHYYLHEHACAALLAYESMCDQKYMACIVYVYVVCAVCCYSVC